MKRAVAIVSRMAATDLPTVRVGYEGEGEGEWVIANANPRRWMLGEPVLVRYVPEDQFATIIDPETLESE